VGRVSLSETVLDVNGDPVPGASVSLSDLAGNRLTLFSSDTGAAVAASVTDATGTVSAFVESPDYDLVVSAATSTATRKVRAGLLTVFAASYGARGDGVTDCGTAINAAISAASAAGGGVVVLGAGVFLSSSQIQMKSKVWLVGLGREATVLRAVAGITTCVVIGLQSAAVTEAGVRDLTIDAASLAGIGGVQVASGSRIRVVDARFVNTATAAVKFINTTDSRVAGCDIPSGTGHGVQLIAGSHRGIVEKNNIGWMLAYGVNIGDNATGGCDDCHVTSNIIIKTMDRTSIECVGVTSNCNRIHVVDNTCIGAGDNGISMSGAEGVVSGNTCEGNRYHGIQFNGPNGTATANRCKNNNQEQAMSAPDGLTRAGIDINTVAGIVVTGNRCWDDQGTKTQDFGVKATNVAGETDCVVVGNSLHGNKTTAVSGITDGVRNCVVTANVT
jgi:hypothetical protein